MSAEPCEHDRAAQLQDVPIPYDPDADEELIMHLERDQLVAETFRPVPRAELGRRAAIGLWALRIFVVLVSAMVIYTFIAGLH
jgi:hypothetical protein